MKSLNLPKQRVYETPAGLIKRFFAFMIDLFIINLIIIMPFKNKLLSQIPESSITETIDLLNRNPEIIMNLYIVSELVRKRVDVGSVIDSY